MTALYTWVDLATNTPALVGVIVDRSEHDMYRFIQIRWNDGRTGTFMEGHEPHELRPSIDGDEQAVRARRLGRLR